MEIPRNKQKKTDLVCRLQAIDLDIAAKAQEHHIPVLFVRNRCDQVQLLLNTLIIKPLINIICIVIEFKD